MYLQIFLYKRRNMDIYKISNINLDEQNKKNLKRVAENMLSTFDEEQLQSIIKVMMTPFYQNELSSYLIEKTLPAIGSEEFNFLLLANRYNGHIIRKIVKEEGISDYYLRKFVEKYSLKELIKGSYIFPNKPVDYLFVLQQRYKITAVSHETALYMQELIDYIPQVITISIPEKYNADLIYNSFVQNSFLNNELNFLKKLGDNRITFVKNKPIPPSQIIELADENGLPLRVTSAERSVVDILKSSYKADEEVKEQAVNSFIRRFPERIARLRRIAKNQNSLKELENYLLRY